jgi:outer membrane beta-barrel protein
MRPSHSLLLLLLPGLAFADEKPAQPAATQVKQVTKVDEIRPSDAEPPLPSCLTEDALRKGVQKKTFLKQHRFELIPQGGLYASDLLSSTYIFGGSLDFFPTEDFGLEVSFEYTPVILDVDKSLAGFFGSNSFKEGNGWLGLANAIWSPIHYKVRASENSIAHGDIMFALGAGKLWNDTTQGFAFDAGVAMELYLTRWFSFRLDIRDVLLIQEVVAETRLTNNIVVMGGFGIWIPFGF